MEGATHNNQDIDELILLSTDKPFLLVFTAEWMSNSAITAVVIQKIKTFFIDEVIIKMVDVDEHKDLVARYRVTSCPTLLIFFDKILSHRINGQFSKKAVIDFINSKN